MSAQRVSTLARVILCDGAQSKTVRVIPLVAAAQDFAETLERFGALTETLGRVPLDSSQGLARAAKTLNEVAACEDDLQARAAALSAAVAIARETQERQAATLRARALEVQGRGEVYEGLLRRFEAIGHQASTLSEAAQKLTTERNVAEGGPRKEEISALISELGEIDEEMGSVAASSEVLATDARTADFDELHRKSDSLRQQLLSARNRIDLLKEALTRAVPRTLIS